jgi:HEPN domain-containing protein
MSKAAPSRQQSPDPIAEARRCLRGADQFLIASHRAFDRPVDAAGKFEDSAPIPGVVCAAFAAELGFKAILLLERRERWTGHKLTQLFAELSVGSRFDVKKAAESRSYLGSDGHRTMEFSEGLDAVSSTFEDWRYFYEKGDQAVDPTFLQKVAKGAISAARALLPALVVTR